MRFLLTLFVGIIIAVFALYFCCILRVFPFTNTLGEFSAMFQPLEALFTALAFVALVVTNWRQSKELRQTKRQTTEILGLAFRLQASGLRLVSMAIEKDSNTVVARQELETQVEEFEQMLQRYLRE